MKLYHSTTAAAARRIVREGFKDGTLTDFVQQDEASRAVSLLDSPADENEGARSAEACIEVAVPDDVASCYELLTEILPGDPSEPGQPAGATAFVAEWAMPALVLNGYPRRLLSDVERDEISPQLRKYRVS